MAGANVFEGQRVLLVEDEYFVAQDLAREFAARGAEVLGPVATLKDALALVAASGRIDAAVLDINLRGEMAFPIADALAARAVPFVFATGYDASAIPARHADVRRCEKPLDPAAIATALSG